jgi:hypothetical protein
MTHLQAGTIAYMSIAALLFAGNDDCRVLLEDTCSAAYVCGLGVHAEGKMDGKVQLHSSQHTHCIKPCRFKAPSVTLVTTACVTMKLIHPMAACCLPAACHSVPAAQLLTTCLWSPLI